MKAKGSEVFSIRCFCGPKRKLTNKLTKREAAIFRSSALYMARWLKKAYRL